MQILVVGGGGREHALAWKLARSPRADRVYCAPGNAGTAREPGIENVDIAPEDIAALVRFARENTVALTVIGPEAPLAAGIVDAFSEQGLACVGPRRAAAQLEGSKVFAKAFLDRHAIPTAKWQEFSELVPALAYLDSQSFPLVIKADGLAAGKGVVIAPDRAAAETALRDMLVADRFGDAGHRVVVEEFLDGEEASFICLADGEDVVPFASSQDHKARDDGDSGPNTGGMGAYSPAPVIDSEIHDRIMSEIIRPTLNGMLADGIRYTGFLYAGLMIGTDGTPRVLEFNCRFGDPEAQPILLRLDSDLVEVCLAATESRLGGIELVFDPRPALGVVMASAGYPGTYEKGHRVSGLPASEVPETKVFHAGTRLSDDAVLTSGGRVLCVCAIGDDVLSARKRAYSVADHINWAGAFYRSDIGYRAIARERQAV